MRSALLAALLAALAPLVLIAVGAAYVALRRLHATVAGTSIAAARLAGGRMARRALALSVLESAPLALVVSFYSVSSVSRWSEKLANWSSAFLLTWPSFCSACWHSLIVASSSTLAQ